MLKSLTRQFLARAMTAAAALTLSAAPLPQTPTADAAHDADREAALPSRLGDANLQIIVLEAPGCTYCNLFRRYVVPAYSASPRAREVPIKFIDLNEPAYDELGLDGPVDLVPTAVLMRNNKEVGRIPGYVGPENFFHAINHLLARVD